MGLLPDQGLLAVQQLLIKGLYRPETEIATIEVCCCQSDVLSHLAKRGSCPHLSYLLPQQYMLMSLPYSPSLRAAASCTPACVAHVCSQITCLKSCCPAMTQVMTQLVDQIAQLRPAPPRHSVSLLNAAGGVDMRGGRQGLSALLGPVEAQLAISLFSLLPWLCAHFRFSVHTRLASLCILVRALCAIWVTTVCWDAMAHAGNEE